MSPKKRDSDAESAALAPTDEEPRLPAATAADLALIDNEQAYARSAWGDDAWKLLSAIEGVHSRKKRLTLLRLAEAALLNRPLTSVFKMKTCASANSHYKWKSEDPLYLAAYEYLVGSDSTPGIAQLARESELDELERVAISNIDASRTMLKLATVDAVRTLVAALTATSRFGPEWRERIAAATAILDRSDDELAARNPVGLTTVEAAITRVYGEVSDSQQATVDLGRNGPPTELQARSTVVAADTLRLRATIDTANGGGSAGQGPGLAGDAPSVVEGEVVTPMDSSRGGVLPPTAATAAGTAHSAVRSEQPTKTDDPATTDAAGTTAQE